jgi:NAD(P)-dependent dehydrogenase (short-subunit alcohol dehydrogenase family)
MHTSDHVALITGASRGLGLALARALAARGWTLIIDARGAEALAAAHTELARSTQVVAIPGDVTDARHRQALAEAAQQHGGLDVVVNNASVLGPSPQPNLLDYPLDVLEQVYRANVVAPLGVLQAVRATMKPGARVLNISSDAGVEAYAGWGGYGSSKAALEQLSAVLAAEQPDWRVYWVDPGDMRTQMHQAAFPGADISDRPLPEESVPGLLELIMGDLPSGRYQARKLPTEHAARAGASELRVVLTVADFEAALRLYRDGLGLPVEDAWTSHRGRGALLEAGRALVELLDEREAAAIDQIEAGAPMNERMRLAFRVNGVAEAAAQAQASGATAISALVYTPWQHHNQRLSTPDDMQITLFEPVTRAEHALDEG